MKRTTKYWGWVGAGSALLLSFAALGLSGTAFRDQVGAVWYFATYPVTAVWMVFLGPLGETGMMFILPMLATQLLFVLAVGFGVGALCSRLFGARNAEPGASPNGGPAERFGNSEAGGGPPSAS